MSIERALLSVYDTTGWPRRRGSRLGRADRERRTPGARREGIEVTRASICGFGQLLGTVSRSTPR